MKRYTLITGASSGIGCEFAKLFASRGHHLIITARNVDKLISLKKEIQELYAVDVCIIEGDLAQKGAGEALYKAVKSQGLEVDILVNNAGAGYVGEFALGSINQYEELLQLNIHALTMLSRLFGRKMKERRKGRILNVASTGAYHPGPYTAVYYATKAYVLSLSEALFVELKPFNVTVSALCPGATKTGFAKAVGRKDSKIAMSPRKAAEMGYIGLMQNKRVILPSFSSKMFVKIPRGIAGYLIGNYQRILSK